MINHINICDDDISLFQHRKLELCLYELTL